MDFYEVTDAIDACRVADTYKTMQQYEPAMHYYNEALKYEPTHPHAHKCVGDILKLQKDLPGALQHYIFSDSYIDVAWTQYLLGDVQRALSTLQSVPSSDQTNAMKALVSYSNGNFEDAEKCLVNIGETYINQHSYIHELSIIIYTALNNDEKADEHFLALQRTDTTDTESIQAMQDMLNKLGGNIK